jgi:cellulose biosynthesis protein BcsQ
VLKRALQPILGDYDGVLIDRPPNVGEFTVAALLAANEIVCPVNMGGTRTPLIDASFPVGDGVRGE